MATHFPHIQSRHEKLCVYVSYNHVTSFKIRLHIILVTGYLKKCVLEAVLLLLLLLLVIFKNWKPRKSKSAAIGRPGTRIEIGERERRNLSNVTQVPFVPIQLVCWSVVSISLFLLPQTSCFLILLIVSVPLKFSGLVLIQLYLPISLNVPFWPPNLLLSTSFTKCFLILGSKREFDGPVHLFLHCWLPKD